MKNIYLQIPVSKQDVSDLALATVTSAEGSTPQKPGSSALFTRERLFAGTVGGGILEGKVQDIAGKALQSRYPLLQLFTLDNRVSDGEDTLCGGKISVLVDPLLTKHSSVFEALRKSMQIRIPGILMTFVTKSENAGVLISRYWITESTRESVPDELLPFAGPHISNLIQSSDSYDFREIRLSKDADEPLRIIFLEPVIPLPRLIIAGAGHIGKALAQVGNMLDFEVTVIDDRPEYASSENIPYADHIVVDDIGKAIRRIEKARDTYIVIVTRGHKDDGNALKACIDSDAAYIGMIGSKNKVALMRRDFIDKGWATPEQWNKICAPVGVEIGSRTVEEIAISIAAQLVQVKNNK